MVLREQGGRTRELICRSQLNKRQLNIIPFKRETFCRQLFLFYFAKRHNNCDTLVEPKTKELNPYWWWSILCVINFCYFRYEKIDMSTKTIGLVGRGSGWQKVGMELGSYFFHPNSSQPGMFQTFASFAYLHYFSKCSHQLLNVCPALAWLLQT